MTSLEQCLLLTFIATSVAVVIWRGRLACVIAKFEQNFRNLSDGKALGRQLSKMETSCPKSVWPGWWAIGIGLLGNICAVLIPCMLFREPLGARTRPMGVFGFTFLTIVLTPICVVPLAMSAIVTQNRRLLGCVAIALALSPAVYSIQIVRYIIAIRGLVILP